MSKQLETWKVFSNAIGHHIENYVIRQYGDEDDELAKDWSAEDCVKQAQTYLARFARGQRKSEEQLDMLKAAHWMQKAWTRLQPKINDDVSDRKKAEEALVEFKEKGGVNMKDLQKELDEDEGRPVPEHGSGP